MLAAPTRQHRLDALLQQVIMPVIRTPQPEAAIAVARALVAGGLRVLEVAWNCAGAAEVLQELRRWDGLLLGVGTILDGADAERALALGADFLVSPILVPGLVAQAHAAGVPAALGCCSPTEIHQAHRLGSDLIKLFPIAAMGGPQLLKDLKEPFGDRPWLVSGSVSLANAAEYLGLGAKVLALGGALMPKGAVQAEDWTLIRQQAEAWRQWLDRR